MSQKSPSRSSPIQYITPTIMLMINKPIAFIAPTLAPSSRQARRTTLRAGPITQCAVYQDTAVAATTATATARLPVRPSQWIMTLTLLNPDLALLKQSTGLLFLVILSFCRRDATRLSLKYLKICSLCVLRCVAFLICILLFKGRISYRYYDSLSHTLHTRSGTRYSRVLLR